MSLAKGTAMSGYVCTTCSCQNTEESLHCIRCGSGRIEAKQVVASSANSYAQEARQLERQEVVVVDVSMPFESMVVFMVKWAIASIPAFIILTVLGYIAAGVVFRVLGGR
jgi:uncharacterized membrane protein YvbJ